MMIIITIICFAWNPNVATSHAYADHPWKSSHNVYRNMTRTCKFTTSY